MSWLWRCAALLLLASAVHAAEKASECREPAPVAAESVASEALLARANAARQLVREGERERATQQLDALQGELTSFPDAAGRAQLRIHVARSWIELGDAKRAAALLQEASGDAQGRDARLESYALGYLAELYEQAGRREEAGSLARRALFAAQSADAPDASYRWQWLLARLLRAEGDAPGALDAYRAAVATLREAPELGGPEVEPLYLELVDLLLRRAAADAANEQALLGEARSALEDLRAGELRDYFRDPCLDAQRKAAPDTVPGALVVYTVSLPERLELIVGREGQLSRHAVDVSREQFDATALDLRRKVQKRTTREFLAPASALYEWLIRPLDLTGVDTLVFVAGGAARTLPFAALYDAQAEKYLIEQVPVAITPGLTLTEPRAIDTGQVKMLAAGVSEAVQGYAALAGVQRELDALHDTFGATRLLDQEFVAARFESEMRERVFDVVHVASHGEFLGDGAESYLLTYDGRIPMDQLGALVGATRFRERGLELLTLSACRTAAGDDRAALGLAGVALRAGARSALATLWAVNDEVSTELMTTFYAQLQQGGVSRAAALQQAQLKVLRSHAYRHPGYWAAYLLISSWL